MDIIWKSLGHAALAYLRWEILLTLFIGGIFLFLFQFLLGLAVEKNSKMAGIGYLTYFILGPVFQVVVMALILTIILPYVVGYSPNWVQYKEVFSGFWVVFLAGLAGLLFGLIISFIPLIGQLFGGPTSTNIFISIPIIVALFYKVNFYDSFSSILPIVLDNKLSFVIALFLGWIATWLGILIAFGIGALISIVVKRNTYDDSLSTILILGISPVVSALPIIFIINIIFYRYIYPTMAK